MDAILIHNPTAGAANVSADCLIGWLKAAGYNPIYQSSKDPSFPSALRQTADLIVVAGGDGTVAKVAMQRPETAATVAILPLGTANNIATALGIPHNPERAIAAWGSTTCKSLSLWTATGLWGEQCFLEGCGLGVLTQAAIQMHNQATHDDNPNQKLAIARAVIRDLASKRPPVTIRAELDDQVIEGQFLLVEMLNIGRVGPRLAIAPQVDPTDDCLNIVLVEAANRQSLLNWLDTDPLNTPIPATIHRCQTLHLTWRDAPIRIDDEFWPEENNTLHGSWQMEIRRAAKQFPVLVPTL